MCLAVVGTIVEHRGDIAVVDVEGNQLKVLTAMIPEAAEGSHVLVHAGFAIGVIDEDEFNQRRRLLQEAKDRARDILDTP